MQHFLASTSVQKPEHVIQQQKYNSSRKAIILLTLILLNLTKLLLDWLCVRSTLCLAAELNHNFFGFDILRHKKVGPFHVMDRIDLHSLQLLQPILATFEAY